MENTICYSKVDIPYLTSDGKQMVLNRGVKLTFVKLIGNKCIVRWCNQIFILNREEILI